jgi:Zn-dependent peptidase ImmA (M78 family)
MKLPSSIKYGCHKYNLVVTDSIRDMDEIWGRIQPETEEIFLRKNLSDGNIKATLLHELIHAILMKTGVAELFCDRPEIHESVCTSVSHGLMEIMQENPALKVLFK